jgi:hypothetical protein
MRKISLLLLAAIAIGSTAMAQKVTTKVIDNKGTIKWVLDSTTAVITKADSTVLYVTPTQLKDSLGGYINDANNGLTKNGKTVQLGGALNQQTTITTTAANFLAITGLATGSAATDSVMVVSPTTGQVKAIAVADLVDAITYTNGINNSNPTGAVKLGGALTEPTTLTTDATNVLKIAGLGSGDVAVDSLVVAAADGTLKRVSASQLSVQSGEQNFTATAGQSTFAVTNLPATASKVWVYRNGAKLIVSVDYIASAGLVTLTQAISSLIAASDNIEVQWVK